MSAALDQELARTSVARKWLAQGRETPLLSPAPSDSKPFVMRMSAHPKEDAFVAREVFLPSFGALQSMSGGRLTAEGIWGEKAHRAPQGVEALMDGRSDLAPCYTSWRAQEYPMLQLLALPGLFPSSEIGTDVSEQLYQKYFRQEFETPGVLLGRLKTTGAYHLFSNKPIAKLRDLRGMAIAVNAGVDSRIAAALGATPVVLNSVELLPALEAGEVDAVSLADGSADVFGIGIRAAYRLNLGASMMNLEFGLSEAFFNSLPSELQVVLNNWLRIQAQAETQILYGLGGALAREKFIAHGCQFIEFEPSERTELDARLTGLSEQISSELDMQGLPASDLVAEARELAEKIKDRTANDLMLAAIEKPRMLLPATSSCSVDG